MIILFSKERKQSIKSINKKYQQKVLILSYTLNLICCNQGKLKSINHYLNRQMQPSHDQVPEKFTEFLEQLTKQTKIYLKLIKESFSQLYKFWISKTNNTESLHKKISEIGILEPDDMNRFMESWTFNKKIQRRLRYKLNQNHQVPQQDLPILRQVTFDFLIQKNHLNDSQIINKIQEFGISINQANYFFSQLNELVKVEDKNQFVSQCKKVIISQFSDFQYIQETDQSTVIEILSKRNSAYQSLQDRFEHLGCENSFELIRFVFSEEESLQVNNPEVQTKKQFTERVKNIFLLKCKILKGKTISDKIFGPRLETLASDLFDQRQKFNINTVKQIIQKPNFAEFNKPQKIPDNLILEIFNIKTIEDLFQKQPEIKVEGKEKFKGSLIDENQIYQDNKFDVYSQYMDQSRKKKGKKCSSLYQEKFRANNQKREKSERQKQVKSDSKTKDLSQKFGKLLEADLARIKVIQKELELINSKTKNTQCLESVLRWLEINILQDKTQKMQKNGEKLIEIINFIGQSQSYVNLVKQITASYPTKDERKCKIRDLRCKLQHLNLQDIIISKQVIQDVYLKCKDSYAILEVGFTQCGKTTTLHGLSGHKLIYSQKTKDYRCADSKLAEIYKIGGKGASQTKECNNSVIPRDWTTAFQSGQIQVKAIDTPGLNDSRDEETDIKNVLGTIKVINNLKASWILIFLSQRQFSDAQNQSIKLFISLMSNYLVNLDSFRKAICFVLTKGLTSQKLLFWLSNFKKDKMYNAMNAKEKEFFQFLEQKIKDLGQEFEIKNPAEHNYKELIRLIVKKYPTDEPGKYISSSFSLKSQFKIKSAADHYLRLVKKIFRQGNIKLIAFYLFKIKHLDEIAQQQNHKACLTQLRALLDEKVSNFNVLFEKYISYSNPQDLLQMKEIRNFIMNSDTKDIYKILYQDNERTPAVCLQTSIKKNLKEALQKFKQPSSIPKENEKRKRAFAQLMLIKEFESQTKYEQIVQDIKKENINNIKHIEQILFKNDFEQTNWDSVVKKFTNQFNLDNIVINQLQNYQKIKQLVLKYFSSEPQELNNFKTLLQDSKTKNLDNELYKNANMLFKKIKGIQSTHYVIKESLEPQTKKLVQQLKKVLTYYEEKKQQGMEKLDNQIINQWVIYQENEDQINKILSENDQSQFHRFKSKKKEEFTIKTILKNLENFSSKLQKSIGELSRNPQNIEPANINKLLQNIFALKKFITQRSQTVSTKDKDKDTKIISLMQDSIKKANENIEKVINKIKWTANSTSIQYYELNFKLIICLLVNKQFENFVQENDFKKGIKQIETLVQGKLLSPLQELKQNKFISQYDFEKLFMVLKYLKALDMKALELGEKANGFRFLVNFAQNNKIQTIINLCFQELKKKFNQFTPIIELSQLNEKFKYEDEKIKLRQEKEKSLKLLKRDLLNLAVQYILSFNHIKKIMEKFMEIKSVKDFMQTYKKKVDLKEIVIRRMITIRNEIKNPQFEKTIEKQELEKIYREFDFLFGVLEKARDETDNVLFVETKKEIERLLAQYLTDFQSLYEVAQKKYSEVQKGVDYNSLKKLINHPGLVEGKFMTKIKNLLEMINLQYEKHLKDITIALDQNENITSKIQVFLNIYEFIKICDSMKYSYSLRQDLLSDGLDKLFKKLVQVFTEMVQQLKNGSTLNPKLVRQYKSYEKSIIIDEALKQKYLTFLKTHQFNNKLEQWFQHQSKKIRQDISKRYTSEEDFKLDDHLKTVYRNVNEEYRQKIKHAAIKSENRYICTINQLLNKDQDAGKQKINQKMQKINLYPEQIITQVIPQYDSINQNLRSQNQKIKHEIQLSVEKKNPGTLLCEYINAINVKSTDTKNLIKNEMQKYIEKQKQSIDFQNPVTLKQNLQRNLKFLSSQEFQKVSEIDADIKKLRQEFIQSLRENYHSAHKTINFEFSNFKQTITQKNSSDTFKLHQFQPVQNNVSAKVVLIIQITKNYTILSQEHQELIKIVEKNIEDETVTLDNEIKAIESFRQKISQKQEIHKQDFIKTIRRASISKQIYTTMKEFNSVGPVKVKVQQNLIASYDNTINELKNLLRQKYVDAKNWNFEDSLLNDTSEMKIKRNKEISTNIKFISNYKSIFFNTSEIPDDFLTCIQARNKEQFEKFQESTKKEIQKCFETDHKYSCQKVRHYYDFMEIKKSTELLAFPCDMKVGDQIKKLLIDKFKANTLKIQNFTTNQKEISQFTAMIQGLNNLLVEEKTILKKKQTQIQNEKTAFLKQHDDKFKIEIKNIPDDDKKEQKKLIVIKEFEGKKSSKLNDFETMLQSFNKSTYQQFTKKRNQITLKINQFVHKQLIVDLIINRQARSYFSCEEEIRECPIKFENLLENIKNSYTKRITKYIYNSLKENENPFSESIIDQQNLFIQYKTSVIQQLAASQTFDKLLDQIQQFKINKDGKKNLLNRYEEYCLIYNKLLELYKNSSQSYDDTLRKITDEAINMGNLLKREYFDNKDTDVVRWKLLAYIFAIWTISKSIFDDEGNVKFVHRPLPGQILAIFLLLNIDAINPSNQIEKCMVQVSTGEGKSVILGALSAYLALVGFSVYEACYSLYLSQRDYKDFEGLFILLKVHKKIKYNIFPQICKLMLDESPQKPFTKKIHDYITDSSISSKIGAFFNKILPDNNKKSSILLIDEADVFLDEKYLGQSYCPAISIKSKFFQDLLEKVWSLRDRATSLIPRDIIQLQEFRLMCFKFNNPIFQQIMQNQTNAMIRDLCSYQNDNYTVKEGQDGGKKIFYKEGDGLSDKVNHGYRTIWAYFHENRINKKLSANDLSKQLFNNLIVAGFSYSKLPFYFQSILGVTGTLESISDGQKQILRNQFGVNKMYVQPSIYPPSNRIISFKKCYNSKIYENIVKSIEKEHNKKRPVIVFFNSKLETYDFFESKQFSKFKKISTIVTYEVEPNERDFRIQFSTQESKITLLTYDYSRGTDFKLKVKDPKTHPGLHVICSFLPSSYSDYIQLTGRTGRQGKNGSVFILIGFEKQLTENQTEISREIAEKDIKHIDSNQWAIKLKEVKEKIKRANELHEKSMKLYSAGTTLDRIFEKIKELNYEAPIMSYNSKTAICIDATCSMSSVLPKVIQVVQGAMPDIYETIEKEKVQGSFELKIVIYRNYSSGAELLLQFTNFESKSEPLVNWLSGIRVNGGQGNEAIEVCFQHINSLQQIHQCVIIGDAPANTVSEAVSKRSCKNETYWNNAGFTLTNFDSEVQKLVQKKIKVHSYYLNPSGTANFYKKLSVDTSGVSEEFKISDKNATKNFADFVANKIIISLGEMVGGDAKERMLKRYVQVSNKKRYVYALSN